MSTFKTHRCEGSLKNKVSIRFCKQYDILKIYDDYEAWRLFNIETDCSYFTTSMKHIAEISSCPFCGELLEMDETMKKDYLDWQMCDIYERIYKEDSCKNTETLRAFIRNSENEFDIESKDIDDMEDEVLNYYVDWLDELWNK